MEFETLRYEVDRGRARITLNRPEKLNALSLQLEKELNQALWEADDDASVHSVILRGAGRAFSAGHDLGDEVVREELGIHARPGRRGWDTLENTTWAIERIQANQMAVWDMHKPVLCGIHGYCLGAATNWALLCDLVVATADCRIGHPPARANGIPPGHMWTYYVGAQWAKRLLFTGDTISGADAARIGLVYKSVPDEEALEDELESLAAKMAHIDHELLASAKRTVNLALEQMGARNMQRLAAELDARSHEAPSNKRFEQLTEELGVKAAVQERDRPFGDGRATVDYMPSQRAGG
jgi:enoyl-CoA hydratase